MRIKKLIPLMVGLLSLAPVAIADFANDTDFIIGCASYHINRDAKYNENNLCLGVQYDEFVALTYKNSEYRQSFLLGWTKVLWLLPHNFGAGVTAGAVTGYVNYKVAPYLAPKLSYDNDHFGADLHVIPWRDPAIGFNVRLKF